MSSFDERGNAQETKFVLDAAQEFKAEAKRNKACLLYTSPSPRDLSTSRMPSSA